MNILVIGSGAREHSICKKLIHEKQVEQVYCLPGNCMMIKDAIQPVAIPIDDFDQIVNFAKKHAITYTIVGPEKPLVEGIVDLFEKNNLLIFGPNQKAAQLEGSKTFAKEIMQAANVATGSYFKVNNLKQANEYLKTTSYPVVLKQNGLASGKGVVIANNQQAAEETLSKWWQKTTDIFIEEYLEGEEFSLMCFVDNNEFIYPLPVARDYKKAKANNLGANTGGMGAYSPVDIKKEDYQTSLMMIESTLMELKRRQINYSGVLYAGLIKTKKGIKVIEFNVRLGDPETEVVLPQLTSELSVKIADMINHKETIFKWDGKKTVGVFLATEGYPDVSTLTELPAINPSNCKVLYANAKDVNGEVLASGRSLFLVASANSFDQARANIYSDLANMNTDNYFFRADIAQKIIDFDDI